LDLRSSAGARSESSAPSFLDATYQGAFFGRSAEAWKQRLVILILVVSDILLALLVCATAFALQGIWGHGQLSEATLVGIVPSIAAWLAIRALMGLYPGYGLDQVEELRRQTYALLATLATTAVFAVAVQAEDLISRLALFLGFLGLLILAPLLRHVVKRTMVRLGLWGKPVVIFRSGEFGRRVATLLDEEWALGYNPVAVFDSQQTSARRSRYEETPSQESLDYATLLVRHRGVDTAIFAMPHTRRRCLAKLVSWASHSFRHVIVIPNLEGITNSAVVARNFAGIFGVEIRYNLLNPSVLRVKRAIDLVATALGGALVLPLVLLLAFLVCLESGRPVFYCADRIGRDGKLFSCIKFRTMVPDAEDTLQRLLETDSSAREEYLKYHKLHKDPRVTRVGRFLRATSLDELPQIWNVLRGEMSLVGPRPYLPREATDIGVMQSEILRVYPGITGPWQVSGRNHISFSERVSIEAYYVRNWSIWLDLVILARTVRTLLLDRGAY
jgi:Undecaprenyl-phosphate galactose phosphotransferase WbaP